MNQETLGTTIKKLREKQGLTQMQFAQILNVSDKAVSKWETARGFPDITFMESIAKVLHVSVAELFTGSQITNKNRNADMKKTLFYVCPICSNVICSTGDAVLNCCGIQLYPLEAEECDKMHNIQISKIEDEYYVSVKHEMSKTHSISFISYVAVDSVQITKLYPEMDAETRFQIRGKGKIYAYCNRHLLFCKSL